MKHDEGPATTMAGVSERYCGFCGAEVGEGRPVPERFGEPFCSEAHAEEFASGVRAARVRAAAESIQSAPSTIATSETETPVGTTQHTWTDRLKTWGCWGAPVLLLLALLLFGTGSGIGVAGGPLLSVLALLACPLAMFFMMRSMGSMNQGPRAQHGEREAAADKEKDA